MISWPWSVSKRNFSCSGVIIIFLGVKMFLMVVSGLVKSILSELRAEIVTLSPIFSSYASLENIRFGALFFNF